MKDSAFAEKNGERRYVIGCTMCDVEERPRRWHPRLDGPFPQLDRVEVESFVDGVRWERALVDPPPDRALLDAEVACCLPKRELQGAAVCCVLGGRNDFAEYH